MPRIVDPVVRRTELAEAVWRVIRREGVERASVRVVAHESGLSTGSLRHYFTTQSELLAFAMRLVTERVQERIAALRLPADVREGVEAVLHELLPLNEERRAEVQVWLAFTGQAQIDPILRALRDDSDELLQTGCRRLLARLAAAGHTDDTLDMSVEAERLHALLDGLSVHATSRPARVTSDLMRATLSRHLDSLRPPRQHRRGG